MKWKQAMEYASRLDAHGHQDWRVPSKGELNVLYNNRAAIGGFNETGGSGGSYWSSSQHGNISAWNQRLCDGGQGYDYFQNMDSSLRCVR